MIYECADYFIMAFPFMKQYNDLTKQNHRLLFFQLLATTIYQ